MRPASSIAVDLEDQSAALRRMAAGIRKSGQPIDVPWPNGTKTLHMLDAIDVEEMADDCQRDADKLRKLHR